MMALFFFAFRYLVQDKQKIKLFLVQDYIFTSCTRMYIIISTTNETQPTIISGGKKNETYI